MRRDRKKDLCRRERDSLEGPHEEAERQGMALKRRKNLAFSEDTCLEKERVRSMVTPRKVGVGLKRKWEPSRRRLGWRLAWWGSTEKKDTSTQTSNPIETELLVWPPPLWGPRGRKTEWPGCQGKEQLTEEGTEAGRSLMKRKVQGQERILAEHLDVLERNDFCDFDKPRKRACQKGKIESNEQSKQGGQPK